MSRDLERGWIRMEWSCLYRVGVNLDRVYWIPALSRGYFEPQNIECRSNHYILLRFLVLLFDIQHSKENGAHLCSLLAFLHQP